MHGAVIQKRLMRVTLLERSNQGANDLSPIVNTRCGTLAATEHGGHVVHASVIVERVPALIRKSERAHNLTGVVYRGSLAALAVQCPQGVKGAVVRESVRSRRGS